MTYSEIQSELRRLGLHSTASALTRAVEEEATRLERLRRRSNSAAIAAAEEFFGKELWEELLHPSPALTADEILNLVRRPTVWAVADMIFRGRSAALKCENVSAGNPCKRCLPCLKEFG